MANEGKKSDGTTEKLPQSGRMGIDNRGESERRYGGLENENDFRERHGDREREYQEKNEGLASRSEDQKDAEDAVDGASGLDDVVRDHTPGTMKSRAILATPKHPKDNSQQQR